MLLRLLALTVCPWGIGILGASSCSCILIAAKGRTACVPMALYAMLAGAAWPSPFFFLRLELDCELLVVRSLP